MRDEVGRASVTPYHLRVMTLIACVMIFDGYDNFVPSYVIHFTKDAWHLSSAQAGMLVSSGLIGFMVGALANGPMADRIGRKPTLIAALVIAGVFSGVTGLVGNTFESFVATRIATGLGLGVLLPLATAYMNEMMPARVSNVTTIIACGGYTFGGMLAGVAGIFLSQTYGWQSLFYVGTIAIPVAALCLFFLPESPLFLVCAGRQSEAAKVVGALAPRISYEGVTFVMAERTAEKGSVAVLFNRENRFNTAMIWAIQIIMLFNAYALIGWIPTVMIARGESFASGFGFGALLQLMSLVGGLACGYVADRMGSRRVALAIWWSLGMLSLLGLATTNTHMLNLLFVVLSGFAIVGPLLVMSNLIAQLFETEVRSTAVGIALGVGRVGGIIGPIAGGWIQESAGGVSAMFLTMASVCVLAVLAVLAVQPKLGELPRPSRTPAVSAG